MEKLYSVKGFRLEEKLEVLYLDKSKPKPKTHVRKFGLIAKDLSWQKAKEIRDNNKQFGAMIFPNIRQEKLKVIQISQPV